MLRGISFLLLKLTIGKLITSIYNFSLKVHLDIISLWVVSNNPFPVDFSFGLRLLVTIISGNYHSNLDIITYLTKR